MMDKTNWAFAANGRKRWIFDEKRSNNKMTTSAIFKFESTVVVALRGWKLLGAYKKISLPKTNIVNPKATTVKHSIGYGISCMLVYCPGSNGSAAASGANNFTREWSTTPAGLLLSTTMRPCMTTAAKGDHAVSILATCCRFSAVDSPCATSECSSRSSLATRPHQHCRQWQYSSTRLLGNFAIESYQTEDRLSIQLPGERNKIDATYSLFSCLWEMHEEGWPFSC